MHYFEGDEVVIHQMHDSAKKQLSILLNSDFSDIGFYFIEEGPEDLVTLSAESETMFAVIQCEKSVIEQKGLREAVDAFCHQLLIDGALARGDKEAFMHYTSHKPGPYAKSEPVVGVLEVFDDTHWEELPEGLLPEDLCDDDLL